MVKMCRVAALLLGMVTAQTAYAETDTTPPKTSVQLNVTLPNTDWRQIPVDDKEVIGQAVNIKTGALIVFTLYRTMGSDVKTIAEHYAKNAIGDAQPSSVQVTDDRNRAWFRFVQKHDSGISVGKFHFSLSPDGAELVMVTLGVWDVTQDLAMIKDFDSITASMSTSPVQKPEPKEEGE